MRVILLVRGAPGCGKSTFFRKYGLDIFSLSADELRMRCQSPQQTVNGSVQIGFSNEKLVWDTLFRLLEIRMQNGEFTVIDATNSKAEEMNRYKKLADEYRYRIYLLDLTSLPIEECKRRNAMRDSLKQVPEEVIDKMYARFPVQHVPSGIKVIKPKDVFNPTIDDLKEIWLKPIDLSSFRRIVHIGDIHGCNTVLQEYLKNGLEDDVFYIFIGDYIDRGIENADVIKFLLSIKDKRNVLLLTGNHECWINMYAHGKKAFSREFELVTKPQLVEFDKKDLRQLCRKFVQCAWYVFHEKEIFVCHGGIATMPDNLTYLATEQMVKGVGNYNDYEAVADTWMSTTKENQYQVFGHRNTKASPIELRNRVFNLEGNVEFGGHLRVVELDHNGFHSVEIKNTVFKPKEDFDSANAINSTDVAKLVIDMRNSKHIQEKKFDNNISSFNFTKTAFMKNIWNALTTHARGLFVDISKMKICCRSYNKFFYLNQGECPDFAELKEKLEFPLYAYVKENGFLGLLSYDEYTDDFRFCSKSVIGGEFADWFKDIFFATTKETDRTKILQYLKDNNVTFIFEVIDADHDPHIIEYPASKIVLLDIVKNQLLLKTLPYQEMCKVADDFGLIHKKLGYVIENWPQFCVWYDQVQEDGYLYNDNGKDIYIEGFVVTDSNGFMFKLKTYYYIYWKKLRPIVYQVWHKGYIEGTGQLFDKTQNLFYGFLQTLYRSTEDKESLPRDIVTLRRMFYENI